MENKYFPIIAVGCIALGIALSFLASKAEAQVQTTVTVVIECNNDNFDRSPRCQSPVDWFMEDGAGGFYGQLLSGVTFRQYPVLNDYDAYFHKMVVEEAYWYIDQEGRFEAESDVQALSIHLTRI